ncbi:MAG: thioredoxin family protein [Azoarcus sp.]|jgi:thiol-disulfide isomerase/thioredoxin|nr:thioredoxin family protein [Azoarcus sp.]
MSGLFDPWNDAAFIAGKLRSPANRLIVIIGAESWCEKCRNLKPHFEELARQAPAQDIMLWFDLEEHQEFLGQYIPESLPEMLIYRNTHLAARSLLPDGNRESLLAALQTTCLDQAGENDPGIARRLAREDWA